jgi:hypothetical protein
MGEAKGESSGTKGGDRREDEAEFLRECMADPDVRALFEEMAAEPMPEIAAWLSQPGVAEAMAARMREISGGAGRAD